MVKNARSTSNLQASTTLPLRPSTTMPPSTTSITSPPPTNPMPPNLTPSAPTSNEKQRSQGEQNLWGRGEAGGGETVEARIAQEKLDEEYEKAYGGLRTYYKRADGTESVVPPPALGSEMPFEKYGVEQEVEAEYGLDRRTGGQMRGAGNGGIRATMGNDRAPPPSATLFSGYSTYQGKIGDAVSYAPAGDGMGYTRSNGHGVPEDLAPYNAPLQPLSANPYYAPLQPSCQHNYGGTAPPNFFTSNGKGNEGSGKSLYEKYLEETVAAKKKFDHSISAMKAPNMTSGPYEPSKQAYKPFGQFNAPKPSDCFAPLTRQSTHTEQGTSLVTKGLEKQEWEQNMLKSPEAYTQPFCEFLTENPTVWHTVQYFEKKLDAAGFKKLSERHTWTSTLEKGGKYYTTRNGSSLIAFTVGSNYKSGNGVAMIAGHIDALTVRLKPVSSKTTKAGYVQLGVAPYAGALNSTWWDRDLGIGGRVLVKHGETGKIETKLLKLGWPIARIPTLAPHFGVGMTGSNNAETEAVPIIGLDDSSSSTSEFENLTLGGAGSFAATQPPKLVRAIAGELSIQDYSSIVNWELELYDTQPAQVGGLDKEFIFAGRIDDKLCSWSAMEALLASSSTSSSSDDGIVKLVGVFDDEEIGSLLRQGARGNFLPGTVSRITESFSTSSSANILSQTYANSFLISADVTHAVNPNFLSRYLENHAPRLNVGLCVCADSNGHMTTDSVSTALLTRIAEKSGSELQLFMIRNDSRSGGTVGPMLSSAMGVRAIDAGIPQLSMHSIRATTGALDPGLGIKTFWGFFEHFQEVDAEFE